VINQCPENKKDYVRNKYATLRVPSTTATAPAPTAAVPALVPIPATLATGWQRPTRPQVPAFTRPPRSTVGSTVSGTSATSTASKRAERYKQLPLLFRIALT